MEDEWTKTEQELSRLDHQNAAVKQEIDDYYNLLMEEFYRRYPQLTHVQEVCLSLATMSTWLEERKTMTGRRRWIRG